MVVDLGNKYDREITAKALADHNVKYESICLAQNK